jgi:cobalamin biosynthesis protein CbiD
MKHLNKVGLIFALSIAATIIPVSTVSAQGGGKAKVKKNARVVFNKNVNAAQERKRFVSINDKMLGSLQGVEHKITYLKTLKNASRYNKNGTPPEELQSMAANIGADIEKIREDISQYAADGEITVSHRDGMLSKLGGLRKLVLDMGYTLD